MQMYPSVILLLVL